MEWNEALVTALSDRVKALEHWRESESATRRNLSERLNAHIRGDIDTPFGRLQGPGELMHEAHPHNPNTVRMTEEQTRQFMDGLWKIGTQKQAPAFCPHCGERL